MENKPPFPEDFEKRVKQDAFLGTELLEALQGNSPTSIRVNPFKSYQQQTGQTIPWCQEAYYLDERPRYVADPHFHAGAYYPQEAGSMMLDKVLRQLELPENPLVLDLCAAPGGKSTLIASFLKGQGILVCNEIISSRAQILKENISKWAAGNVVVCNNEPTDFQKLPNYFDLIAIDAPCSGEGMFRKDPNSRKEWSEANVLHCSKRQQDILSDCWSALKEGGYIIYSTCTFNANENEQNVEWMLANFDVELITCDFSPFKAGRSGIGAYSLPSLVQGEGFFLAVLRKKGEQVPGKHRSSGKNWARVSTSEISRMLPEIPSDGFDFWKWRDRYFAIHEGKMSALLPILEEMRIVHCDTEIGEFIRNKFIPEQTLAMNHQLSKNFDRISLNHESALRYLKGETFPLLQKSGLYIVEYEGSHLGWIKHLGNRFNNLYPKKWRIRISLDAIS
ncbi:MAG: RNA methyltransferase [Bacteroidetes bacterium]|nr:MAG: RNA methyltransferase [Bacteroidota bacterium]